MNRTSGLKPPMRMMAARRQPLRSISPAGLDALFASLQHRAFRGEL
jgi:hypothetical protein